MGRGRKDVMGSIEGMEEGGHVKEAVQMEVMVGGQGVKFAEASKEGE